MATNYIKNSKGQTVGYITDAGSTQYLKKQNGNVIARFDDKATYYSNGSKVGDGNLLQTLIPSLMN